MDIIEELKEWINNPNNVGYTGMGQEYIDKNSLIWIIEELERKDVKSCLNCKKFKNPCETLMFSFKCWEARDQ